MEILLTKRDQLLFEHRLITYSWFWGYHYNPVDKPLKENESNAVSFYIKLKDRFDNNLFKEIKNMLKERQKQDSGIVITFPKRMPDKELIGIKPEFQDQAAAIEEENQKTAKKIDALYQQLDELGAAYEPFGFTVKPIPEEWYEWKEGKTPYANMGFTVCCHHNTEFYKFIKENNLI